MKETTFQCAADKQIVTSVFDIPSTSINSKNETEIDWRQTMGKIFKKKQLVLTALVVLLGVAVYINWYYTRPENQVDNNLTESTTQTGNLGEAEFVDGQTPEGEEYFAAVKLNRSTAHDEALKPSSSLLRTTLHPKK